MKPIRRHLQAEALDTARQFTAMCLVGPRQSGKTTLTRSVFKDKTYVNLENPLVEAEAAQDVDAFLKQYGRGAILDEVQRLPAIFRHLQELLDNTRQRGLFILTGSNNFLLQEQVSQSLAGRVGYLELLPLSYAELKDANLASDSVAHHILRGGYPELWQHRLNPTKWMASYVQTYVQRDVRLLRNISNLGAFARFVQLCAAYAGQQVNKDALAKGTGVDAKTIHSWLTLLESSYVIYLLPPFHSNLGKRIVKSPKLYFYDTGLLCYLLDISSENALINHSRYGALFENWIVTEIRKNRSNRSIRGGMYYFRDSAGNEVDLILEKQGELLAIEIKSGKKYNTSMVEGLRYWQKYNRDTKGLLIMGGSAPQEASAFDTLSWKDVGAV